MMSSMLVIKNRPRVYTPELITLNPSHERSSGRSQQGL